jgi:hypothetical protein
MDEAATFPGHEKPRGDIEKALAQLWGQVFKSAGVGRDDNFFELGGNSLTGLQLTELLATRMSVQLPVVALFLHPTVRELAQLITDERQI